MCPRPVAGSAQQREANGCDRSVCSGGWFVLRFSTVLLGLPTLFLSESAAAVSIGLINSVGNLGGFVGPMVMGYLASRTHSFAAGLWYLVGSLIVSGILMLTVGAGRHPIPDGT